MSCYTATWTQRLGFQPQGKDDINIETKYKEHYGTKFCEGQFFNCLPFILKEIFSVNVTI
jgi:hypothetical protein